MGIKMMFQEFMQMGMPASIALLGFSLAISGTIIAIIIRNQTERTDVRKFEIERIEVSSKVKQIEHKHKD